MQYYQLSCTSIAVSLNLLLVYLILTKSPKNVGSYKYLMVYTAFFEMCYSIFDWLSAVQFFSYRLSVGIHRPRELWMPEWLSSLLLLIYGSIFGSTMSLLIAHFLYRYAVTNSFSFKEFTKGWRFHMLFVMQFVYGAWWTVPSWLCAEPTMEADRYLRPYFANEFDLQVGTNVSYKTVHYYNLNGKGLFLPSWVLMVNCNFLVTSSFICVIFFATKCYTNIKEQLEMMTTTSKFFVKLQKELFNALVVQTMIPAVFLYTPACAFFVPLFFGIELGKISGVLTYLIALYPMLDPLPCMFIIKGYRDAIKKMLGCKVTVAPSQIGTAMNSAAGTP